MLKRMTFALVTVFGVASCETGQKKASTTPQVQTVTPKDACEVQRQNDCNANDVFWNEMDVLEDPDLGFKHLPNMKGAQCAYEGDGLRLSYTGTKEGQSGQWQAAGTCTMEVKADQCITTCAMSAPKKLTP